jgi:hypothetical protein
LVILVYAAIYFWGYGLRFARDARRKARNWRRLVRPAVRRPDSAPRSRRAHRCAREVTVYEGKSQQDKAAFTYEPVAPDSDSWAGGDRSLMCIAYKPNDLGGASVSYSIKGGH